MAKKDPAITEDLDRQKETAGNDPLETEGASSENEKDDKGLTQVKNANASGLGSMGRNDTEVKPSSSGTGF